MENKNFIIDNYDHLCISPTGLFPCEFLHDYYQVVPIFFILIFFTYKIFISSIEFLHIAV